MTRMRILEFRRSHHEDRFPFHGKTGAIALAGKTMGDRAAYPGGSAGDDDGAGGMLYATHQ
jgi:hypothetical protein